MSMLTLKKALKSALRDEFEVGTVVRWLSSGTYTYAALKTPVGWYTTATPTNPYVNGVLTFEELVEVLTRSETSEVAVSDSWELLS